MRTTITIDDAVYERARRIAFEQRRTLGEVINELLLAGLTTSQSPSGRRTLGALRGSVWIADDFDETPSEVLSALEEQP